MTQQAGPPAGTHLDPTPHDRSRRAALAALLTLAPLAARAQAHPLTGKWDIEHAAGMRVENGEPTPLLAKALLTMTFKQGGEAKLNMNGEEHTATVISTWLLDVDGDVLTGTLGREIQGMEMPTPPPPVTGRRAP